LAGERGYIAEKLWERFMSTFWETSEMNNNIQEIKKSHAGIRRDF